MSDKYKSSKDVPLQVIIIRLNELSDSIIAGKDVSEREFTMRIPAECDRDADLVLAEAANRLTELEQWKKQAQDRFRIDLDKNLELEQENQRLREALLKIDQLNNNNSSTYDANIQYFIDGAIAQDKE